MSRRQIARRRAKLTALRDAGTAYPNDFRRSAFAQELHREYTDTDGDSLDSEQHVVAVAGRLMTRRVMGKASFAHLRDSSGEIQLYAKRDDVGEGAYGGLQKLGSRGHSLCQRCFVQNTYRRALS